MSKRLPYPEHLASGYPRGIVPDRRRITKCSEQGAWYANKVGKIITVHHFATFGAYDTKGRWLWYYDLSAPIVSIKQRLILFFKKLFGK
jgi:hypothetical protein